MKSVSAASVASDSGAPSREPRPRLASGVWVRSSEEIFALLSGTVLAEPQADGVEAATAATDDDHR